MPARGTAQVRVRPSDADLFASHTDRCLSTCQPRPARPDAMHRTVPHLTPSRKVGWVPKFKVIHSSALAICATAPKQTRPEMTFSRMMRSLYLTECGAKWRLFEPLVVVIYL